RRAAAAGAAAAPPGRPWARRGAGTRARRTGASAAWSGRVARGGPRVGAGRSGGAARAAQGPVGGEQHQHRSDDGADEPADVEGVGVADAEEAGEDEPADERPDETEDERHQPGLPTFEVL